MPASQPNSSKIKKVVYNLSDRVLSTAEQSLLEKGLGFSITRKQIPDMDFKVACENFARKLVVGTAYPIRPTVPDRVQTPPFRPNNSFFPENLDPNLAACLLGFGQKCRKILQKASAPSSNISRSEREAIRCLRNDPDTEILPADKGNATVVMSRTSYVERMMVVLDDPAHFERIDANPTAKWEKILRKFLLQLKNGGYLPNRLYRFLRPSDARTPQLYGLPKIHKPSVPLQPVVSVVHSFNFNIGKFLVWLLSPYMMTCDSYVKNSTDFVQRLSRVKPGYSRRVSFDVISLFTNVPVNEAVDLALEIIANDQDPRFRLPLKKLKKLFDYATKFCCFEFNGIFFLQIDGLSMGNPLAPPLAHLSTHRNSSAEFWNLISDLVQLCG